MRHRDGRPVRIVLAKPGLDGHDRGVKVIAMALRDAGAEVIYVGLRRSPEEILQTARDEGADVVGLSVLSGAHLALCDQLVRLRHEYDCDDLPIVVGGTIPDLDVDVLLHSGVAAVYPVGSDLREVVASIATLATRA